MSSCVCFIGNYSDHMTVMVYLASYQALLNGEEPEYMTRYIDTGLQSLVLYFDHLVLVWVATATFLSVDFITELCDYQKAMTSNNNNT